MLKTNQITAATDADFPVPTFKKRIKSMLRLDFYRLFRSPIFYIMLGVAAIIPALILTMGMAESPDGEAPQLIIDNVWQLISTKGSAFAVNGMAGFATIDMVFIFAGILMAIFVARDYMTGFIKNIFTVHSKKEDYVISKTAVGVFSGVCMILTYTLGTILCGAIMGKGFDVNVGGLILCLLSKMVMMLAFCSLFLAIAVFFKDKLWLTIICTFLFGMVLYPVAIFANLDSNILTFIMSTLGSVLLGVGFYYLSRLFMRKRDLA